VAIGLGYRRSDEPNLQGSPWRGRMACASCLLSLRRLPLWPVRRLVVRTRRIADSKPGQDLQGARDVSPGRSLAEVRLGSRSGQFLRHCHVDELVDGYVLSFRDAAQFLQKRRLKAAGQKLLFLTVQASRIEMAREGRSDRMPNLPAPRSGANLRPERPPQLDEMLHRQQ
jgi:hypothetical protein